MVSRLSLAAMAVSMVLLAGCSGAQDRPPLADLESGGQGGAGSVVPGGSAGTDAGGAGPVGPVCTDGETQKCKVKLPSQSGVNNCFVGLELCENGQWGPCSDPSDIQSKSANGFGGVGGAG